MSLELRWIFEDSPPLTLQQWFLQNDFSSSKMRKQEYLDTYLFNPEVDYISVKFRGNKLGIKWKKSSFPFEMKSNNCNGIVEDWIFWEWSGSKGASDRIGNFTKIDGTWPWIEVQKERFRYGFQYRNQAITPVKIEERPDCSIELVTLKPRKSTSIRWWSLGIDFFSGMKTSNTDRINMKKISEELLQQCPINDLPIDLSYGLPKLFQIYRIIFS